MKFGKTLFFFLLFASAAVGIRWAVFGRGEASKPLETQGMAVSVEPVQESPSVQPSVEAVVKPVDNVKPPKAVQVVGYVMRGSVINLWLSDGRFLTEKDPELQEVRKNYALISGEKVWFVRPVSRAQTDYASRSEAERGFSHQSGSDALGSVLGSGQNSPVK